MGSAPSTASSTETSADGKTSLKASLRGSAKAGIGSLLNKDITDTDSAGMDVTMDQGGSAASSVSSDSSVDEIERAADGTDGPAEEGGGSPDRVLFDGALVDEHRLRDYIGGDSVKSSETVSLASSVLAATEGCVEHAEDGSGCGFPGSSSRCRHSLYGRPRGSVELGGKMKMGGGGLIWIVRLLPDDFDKGGKLGVLPKRDYDAKKKCIKPRRGSNMPVKTSDFFSSLVLIEDVEEESAQILQKEKKEGPLKATGHVKYHPVRWVFSGVLNGWPALTCLEVLSIQTKGKLPRWSDRWNVDVQGQDGIAPSFPSSLKGVNDIRATLRAAPWSAHGWSEASPGFLLWYEPHRAEPRLRYGTEVVAQVERDRIDGERIPRCRRVHMVSHRYATGGRKESSKERLTYHSVVLLEWDHGKYCTVIEVAFLNGLGGFSGRSNWYDDKQDDVPGLYRTLPPEIVMPWKERLSEIRCLDVPARNLDEFKEFIDRHRGLHHRFVGPCYTFSHDVRLTFNSKDHIATYLLNYIQRDRTYSEIRRNCQTFAADLCGFLVGKRDVQPFHPVNQIQYKCKKHHFLYESNMY